MSKYSRIPTEGILYLTLSLPNQPMGENRNLGEILREIGMTDLDRVGLVGWKLIYTVYGTIDMYDVPSFIVEGVRDIAPNDNIVNATNLFIHLEYGVSVINSAEEIGFLNLEQLMLQMLYNKCS